jgi:hypothetical protein
MASRLLQMNHNFELNDKVVTKLLPLDKDSRNHFFHAVKSELIETTVKLID